MFWKKRQNWAQWLTCISTIFHDWNSNKDSKQRVNQDGSFFAPQKIIFSTPAPQNNQFSVGMKNLYFSAFSVEKCENLGILVKLFGNDIIFNGKMRFSACWCFFVIHRQAGKICILKKDGNSILWKKRLNLAPMIDLYLHYFLR